MSALPTTQRRWLLLGAELAGPLALVGLVALVGSNLSAAQQTDAVNVLVTATIVVGLYVFIGNSGVMSFGQISFTALGAFAAGILTSPVGVRKSQMPTLFGFLARPQLDNVESLLLATALGAVFALVVGAALMRLSGLAAGIATFAVLGITYNVLGFWNKVGPAATTLAVVPVTTGIGQGALGCAIAIAAAFAHQHTRSCRQLRASRADPLAARGIGVSIFRHRLVAFVLSGAICGFAGALFVHELGSINVNQVYLDLTFSTLAMLVVGGAQSLFGATLGGTLLGTLSSFLDNAENGTSIAGLHFTLPNGLSTIIFAILLVGALMLAPSGLSRGREFPAALLPDRFARSGRRAGSHAAVAAAGAAAPVGGSVGRAGSASAGAASSREGMAGPAAGGPAEAGPAAAGSPAASAAPTGVTTQPPR
jgi:branched-chain amino acid transport system permease protein